MARQNQVAIASNMEPWLELNNKVVMVTGASSGLGWEFCLDLAKAGCKIIAAARRIDRLKSLCDEINGINSSQDHPTAVALELDITSSEDIIEASVKTAWNVFGIIDVLINNAGLTGRAYPPLGLPAKEWENTVQINLTGTWLVSKYVGIHMRDSKQGGSVINITSTSATERLHHGGDAYIASKTAIHAITKAMALDLGKYNIRVNSVAPGIFRSEITEGLFQKHWFKKVLSRTIPLGTFGTTDPALTSIIRYLIHDSSHYVTGNVFIVDAGATLGAFPIFSSSL